MRRNELTPALTQTAFDFFFWFSRFEYALKENGYLRSHEPGAVAEPGWDEFIDNWAGEYVLTPEARALIQAAPQRQVVGTGDALLWRAVGTSDCSSELSVVVRLLKTIRNNLFHGGKHGHAEWDDPQRTDSLLRCAQAVLGQLAAAACVEADYQRRY